MGRFNYETSARRVNAAHAEVGFAFSEMKNRHGENDPRTQRWHKAIEAFHSVLSQAYAKGLQAYANGGAKISYVSTDDILDFLEADPVFHGSGYTKEALLKDLRKRTLTRSEVSRVQSIVLKAVVGSTRREFRRYCNLAAKVDDPEFRSKIIAQQTFLTDDVRRRASWVLDAMRSAQPAHSNSTMT